MDRVKIRSVLTCQSRRGVCINATGAISLEVGWSKKVNQSASLPHSQSESRVRS